MKKVWIFLMIAALLACTACGAKTTDTETEHTVSETVITASDFITTMSAQFAFDDSMTLVGADQAKSVYGISDEDGYTGDCALYISTMATPEEIAVFEVTDDFSAERLTELANARIAQQKESYASYAPQEMPKLDSAVIRTVAGFVIVCVTADNAAAQTLLDSFVA